LKLNSKPCQPIVFSDLDGTLLDKKFSYANVLPMVKRLVAANIPLVLCSSKTRGEIEYYRKKFRIDAPFIVENGAAIFVPKGYFHARNYWTRQTNQYDIIELGIAYSSIRRILGEIKKESNLKIKGFGDMTVAEIARETGLSTELAELSKQREYSEPFTFNGKQEKLYSIIRKKGLRITNGGKYFHLMGNHDKGRAVSRLKELYCEKFNQLRTIAVGNQCNDLEMLEAVDIPFLVGRPEEMNDVWEKVVYVALQVFLGDCSFSSTVSIQCIFSRSIGAQVKNVC
jgi:mannosyl-3-phosphoglycerate phosphatase